jgi:hypothetical protein
MNLKLSNKQRLNLLRLSQGRSLNVCTQVRRSCGKVFLKIVQMESRIYLR